jgi:hypothetical protein
MIFWRRAYLSSMYRRYMAYRTDRFELHIDRELELDFIREFAVGGDLRVGSSVDGRRERIRVAIYSRNLLHEPFRDSGLDYGQAYQRCYGRPIELRRTVSHEPKPKLGNGY